MKTITKVIAVMMTIAVLACLMAACGESKYYDSNVVGTWQQTDDIDGNWTWVYNADGTCRLTGGPDNFDSEGTYYMEDAESGKLHISLKGWDKEHLFTYAVTTRAMVMESTDLSFQLKKQQ